MLSINQFKNLPDEWSVKKLKYVFDDVGSGTTPNSSNRNYYNGTIPWVTTSELRENIVCETKQYLSEKAISDYSSLKLYPIDSLLIAMYGATIGRLGILGIPATVNQAVCVLSKPNNFKSKFAYYSLLTSREYLKGLALGGGQPNLNAETVKNHIICCPPASSQQRIIDFLDQETQKIDNLIKAKQSLLNLLKQKKQALINRAVTRGIDSDVRLKETGVDYLGEIPEHWEIERTRWLFDERNDRSETGEEELLTVSHITGVTSRKDKNVNMFKAETNEGYKITHPGDLVINTLWAWMGAMGISPLHGLVSPAYHVYTPNDRLCSEYVELLVRMPIFATEVTRYSKGVWSSRLRLYPVGFYEVYFPVPPVDEQKAIAAYVKKETKKIATLKKAALRSIDLLKERRRALISAAVTGKIKIPEV